MLQQVRELAGYKIGKQVKIRRDIDERYRRALLEGARSQGGKSAAWHIGNALDNGPDRKGAAEAIRYFGNDLETKLAMTAPIIDGLEVTIPGFKKWLELTGYGNDRRMIQGFVAWAEHQNTEAKLIKAARHTFDN